MDLLQISYFLTASILLTLTPGPDILYVVAQSLSFGKKAGIVTALGLCSGLFIHIFMVAVGIAALLKSSSWGLPLVQVTGAAYLFFLAYQTLKENSSLTENENIQDSQDTKTANKGLPVSWTLYRQGFYMSSLNPKLIIFFLAFFPQFLHTQEGGQTLQIFVLGFLFVVQALLIFTLISYFADSFGKNLRSVKFLKGMNYFKAAFLLLLAFSLLWEQFFW